MKHVLPLLPYAFSALEPHIDMHTMILHHDEHHASYVQGLNLALEAAPEVLQDKSAEWLLLNLPSIPEKIRTAIGTSAGGHLNHSLLWRSMSPEGGGAPSGSLASAIEQTFGSLDHLKTQFEAAGSALFGSGWVWLVRAQQRNAGLEVLTTAGHDTPLAQGYFPILVNDAWEHAYYLKYENRRAEYLRGWWSITNWKEAERRFHRAVHVAQLPLEPTANTAQAAFR